MTCNLFIQKKNDFLTELNKHNNKLLFPESVILSMEKQKLTAYCLKSKAYEEMLNPIAVERYSKELGVTHYFIRGLSKDGHKLSKTLPLTKIENLIKEGTVVKGY